MPKTSRQSIGGRRRYQPDADRFVDDLDQLRAELNLDRIAVLGHSSQGFIALRYAARHPDHASYAIVIGGILAMDASFTHEQEALGDDCVPGTQGTLDAEPRKG